MVSTGLEVIGALAAIRSLIESLVKISKLVAGLSGCGPKCRDLLQEMRTLESVLCGVERDFKRLVGYSSNNLDNCVSNCLRTSKALEAVLAKVHKSRVRSVRWKVVQSEVNNLSSRLEGNKSTLILEVHRIK